MYYTFVLLVSILITWFFSFTLGIIVGIILLLAPIIIPTKKWTAININVALEGLSYGKLNDAKDHIIIAIREAENAAEITLSDIKLLREACDKIINALEVAGYLEDAKDVKNRVSNLSNKLESKTLD